MRAFGAPVTRSFGRSTNRLVTCRAGFCFLLKQSDAAVATTRGRPRPQPESPPLPKISPGSPAPRMGAGPARNTRLDAAMIFPVNKIPISTVIEGRGAQEMVALVLRPKPEESVRFAHCTLIT